MEYTLKELLDIPRLLELLATFDEIHSMPSAIIDTEGVVLTATAWQDICTKFHRVNPDTLKKCIESDTHISAELDKNSPNISYRCPMGLVDSAIPIIIEGKHLGNVFTGQLFLDPPDENRFIEQARTYGFNEEEYLAAMRKVPYFTEAHMRRNLNFIHSLAMMLAEQELQRKRLLEAQKNLRESDAFNQQIINSAHEGIIVYGPDLRYRVWNPFMERISGLRKEDVLGRLPLEVFPFLGDVGVTERLEQALAGKTPEPAEFPYTFNGKSGWTIDTSVPLRNEKNEITGVIATIQDITVHKNSELLLRESEQRFRSIVESSPNAMYFYQLGPNQELILTGANPSADRIIGFSHMQLLGKRIEDAFPGLADTSIPEMYREVARGTLGQQSFEITYDNGDIRGVFDVTVYCTGQDAIAVEFQEISGRKKIEEERISLEKQLLHAQKLESLGVLAGGIAHDFNNILMAIMGNVDLALMRINPESPVIDSLRKIEEAAARAADLAKQMLAYSGKGKFVIENINLNRLLEDMLHMLEVSISKKAVLRFSLASTIPTVEADATQLRQIIMNLVINASEAIGDKSGVIAITTGCMDCDRSYLKDVWLDANLKDGLYVYLEIADTGCGMDRETMSKVFDPFFTTKFTGRGLGMAAVLGIVRGHKGAIKIYSELGKGTTFKILLPASNRPAELFNGVSHNHGWSGSGRVLLVDDEETVRGIGSEMLKELGFAPVTAEDGREAVRVFRETPDIGFVILDLTMPHMDGEQCFRELRQINPDVKVIMSSGYNEQEVTQKFVGKGLAGFIQKPYKLSALKEAVMKLDKK